MKGTYEQVEDILNMYGLKRVKGKKPEGILFEIAEMLSLAYMRGYEAGRKSD